MEDCYLSCTTWSKFQRLRKKGENELLICCAMLWSERWVKIRGDTRRKTREQRKEKESVGGMVKRMKIIFQLPPN
jgi:hypothetical protein